MRINVYIPASLMILAVVFSFSGGFPPACAGSSDVSSQPSPENVPSLQESSLPDVPEKMIGSSSQVLLVRNTNPALCAVQVFTLEKRDGRWQTPFALMDGVIGKNGFAPQGEKREGDGRTPSGIFPLGMVFGYQPSFPTRMSYRQTDADDLWVDDVQADDYNRWTTKGTTKAASFERMRRDDDLYKLGVVVEYNTNPVIKGYGSAIFFHLWRGKGIPTAGCVALSEEDLGRIVRWLDPAAQPVVIMGTNITVENIKK
ncbi:MAG: L,D-transpeptidase family protein [Deltaproteobacteria bacterium]|nr:L,D-transpeptidase family protein [Deltaproteobacteria bacterium]